MKNTPFVSMWQCSLGVRVVLCISMGLLLLCGVVNTGYTKPRSFDELSRINDNLIETSVSYGAIPSLYCPVYGRASDSDLSMDKQTPVFVVLFPGGPRIYPQRIMVWHSVVNEIEDDVAYAVTYCPITGCLAAYNTSMEGLNLILDADGRLYDGNTVLIDRNTGSLWLQALGMSFDGTLLGRAFPQLPVFWTTWAAAYRTFPNAKVLLPPAGSKRSYFRDPYGDYLKKGTYYDNETLIYKPRFVDRRLPRKNPVVGLEIDRQLIAIDVKYVKENGAVNFFIGELPLLAVHDKKLDVVRIFNRQIWTAPSLFTMKNGKLIDIGSQTVWDASTGTAVDGNMKGAAMPQYYGTYSMWFAWYDINPETLLIPGPGEVPKHMLQTTPLDQLAPPAQSAAPGQRPHVDALEAPAPLGAPVAPNP